MVFVTVYFWLTVASAALSIILLILAGIDRGTSSFYLLLLSPSLTIIHHAIIVFLPTYMPQQFTGEKRTGTLPPHATKTYISFMGLLSGLWTLSTLLTFYAVGMNIAHHNPNTNQHTGAAECVFAVFECGVSWTMLILCVKERWTSSYKSVPLSEGET